MCARRKLRAPLESIDTIMPGGLSASQSGSRRWTWNRAKVKVGPFSVYVRDLSQFASENLRNFQIITPLSAFCKKRSDWSNQSSRHNFECNEVADWSATGRELIEKNSKEIFGEKFVLKAFLSFHPSFRLGTICGSEARQSGLCWDSFTKRFYAEKKSCNGSSVRSSLESDDTSRLKHHKISQVIKDFKKVLRLSLRPSFFELVMVLSHSPPAKPRSQSASGRKTNNSMNAAIEADKMNMPPPGTSKGKAPVEEQRKDQPLMSEVLKNKLEISSSDEEDNVVEQNDVAEIDKKAVADQFNLTLDQKGKIATLLQTGVLVVEPKLQADSTITAETMEKVRSTKKHYTTRIRFENIGVGKDEKAARPGDDVIDEFLYLEEGLGLPVELMAQSYAAFDMDKKGREAENVFYKDGLSQFWEIKISTWVPLNLQLVCGKKEFRVGSGKDLWKVKLPGAPKEEEEVLYCHGICSDSTISNQAIQRAIEKLQINVQGGNNGVKDSTIQTARNGEPMQTGRKYFFTNSKFLKKEDGTYDKLRVGIYSKVNRKEVQISFNIRDKKMREEAEKQVVDKCKACGKSPPDCTGADGVKCTWKDVGIKEFEEKLRRLGKLNSIVTGGVQVAPKQKTDDVSEQIIKYMTRIKDDSDEERAWRIKRLAAATLDVEAERLQGSKKSMDGEGFTKVGKSGPKARRFTIHQPFDMRLMRQMADYSGGFNNKDRLIASIYRWPSTKYENNRAKALVATLNVVQMRDLVARVGVLDTKTPEEVGFMDGMGDDKARAEKLAKWLHEFVEANEDKICKSETK